MSYCMFLCVGATPILPDINTTSIVIIASTFWEVIIQDSFKKFYLHLEEWMPMFDNNFIILLGTAGSFS